MKSKDYESYALRKGRSPYGERGLKYDVSFTRSSTIASLSLRRAWIEIIPEGIARDAKAGRSPYGERGLKSHNLYRFLEVFCRSPYGERGLKCEQRQGVCWPCGRSPYGERGLK